MKYVFDPAIKKQVEEILAPLKNPEAWSDLELPFSPSPSAVVRMEGASGIGKTALANHMAAMVSRRPAIQLNFQSVASHILGETEKNIVATFERANGILKEMVKGNLVETKIDPSPVIIMEECDALIWNRGMIQSEDNIHVLGFVNTLLQEIDKFTKRKIPSLLILTSNYPLLLDPAMERRVTDVIKLAVPQGNQAVSMWTAKLPMIIKKQLRDNEWKVLAASKKTPAQIETIVVKACRRALLDKREPNPSDLDIY